MKRKVKNKTPQTFSWGGDRSGLGKPVGKPKLKKKEKRIQLRVYVHPSTLKAIKDSIGLQEFGHQLDDEWKDD